MCFVFGFMLISEVSALSRLEKPMKELRLDSEYSPQLGFSSLAKSRPGTGERAKFKLARALEELMLVKPFSKISVLALTERAAVSRQTFYNHFVDKTDLVAWIGQQLDLATYSQIGIELTWEEACRQKLSFMKSKEPFYCELFEAESHTNLFEREVESTFRCYERILIRMSGLSLTEQSKLELKLFCYGVCGLISEWSRSGMAESIDSLMRAERSALPSFAKKVFLGE